MKTATEKIYDYIHATSAEFTAEEKTCCENMGMILNKDSVYVYTAKDGEILGRITKTENSFLVEVYSFISFSMATSNEWNFECAIKDIKGIKQDYYYTYPCK